jgi:hypothetical protein
MAKVHNAELLASDDLVVELTNLNGDWEQGVVPSDPNGVVSGELGDLVVQENDGVIWKNTDGATEWKQILAGREVYAFNGAPSGTPDNPDAVAYDYSTGSLYYWDPVALTWEPSAGNMLDWHVDGNAGTSPLSAAGTDYVGTSDDVVLDIATDGTSRITVGDTANDAGAVTVHPDGTNDRVTITDVDTTIVHSDTAGTGTDTVYAGNNMLGMGLEGAAMVRQRPVGIGAVLAYDTGTGSDAMLFAAEPGFVGSAQVLAHRLHGALDQSECGMNCATVSGAYATISGYAAPSTSSTSLQCSNGTDSVSQSAQAGSGVPQLAVSVSDSVTSRGYFITADRFDVTAGDRASNAINGDDLEVLARYGTGTSEVRFTPRTEIRGTGYVEQRGVAAAGVETISHNLDVPVSALSDWPVLIQIIDDATNQVVIPSTIQFINSDTVNIGFAASGTYRIYVSALAG